MRSGTLRQRKPNAERDLLGDKFARRFLTPAEFGTYANHLHLVPTSGIDDILQFLERERALVPAIRVQFPDAILVRWFVEQRRFEKDYGSIDATLKQEPDGDRYEAALALDLALSRWSITEPWLRPHPLDAVQPEWRQFVTPQVDKTTFVPWGDLKVVVGRLGSAPLRQSSVRTFYHASHIFLLAEILRSSAEFLFNPFDEQIFRIAVEDPRALPRGRAYVVTHFTQAAQARRWGPLFSAVEFFHAYRLRALVEAAGGLAPVIRLQGERHGRYQELSRIVAREAAWRFGVVCDQVISFLQWQCQQWEDWQDRDHMSMAEEYERGIALTVLWYRYLVGASYEDVDRAVGRLNGFHKPSTLSVVLPDWVENETSDAARVLRRWIKPKTAIVARHGLELSDGDCDQIPMWFRSKGLFHPLWLFARLREFGAEQSEHVRAALAKEIEGAASTLEHFLNDLAIRGCIRPSNETLQPKLRALWGGVVESDLTKFKELARTDRGDPFATQYAKIGSAAVDANWADVTRPLLSTLLIRNHGQHGGFMGYQYDELMEMLATVVLATMLCWKKAQVCGTL